VRREMAEACLFGRPLGFPVDTTSRASHRACNDPGFPVRLGGDTVHLKDTPICLQWRSKTPRRGVGGEDGEGSCSTPIGRRTSDRLPWDPHRVGFGPVPSKVRTLPPIHGDRGVLGKDPLEETRGGRRMMDADGEGVQGGEATATTYPPLSLQWSGGSTSSSHSVVVGGTRTLAQRRRITPLRSALSSPKLTNS
jgi:hypothetical protein